MTTRFVQLVGNYEHTQRIKLAKYYARHKA